MIHMNRWISDMRDDFLTGRHGGLLLVLAAVLLLSAGCSGSENTAPAQVNGSVAVPLTDARVYIYSEGDDIYGPAQTVSEATGSDGSFSLALAPGRYLAVVRKRASGDTAGPVVIGDHRSEPFAFEVAPGQEKVQLALTATLKVANEKTFPARNESDGGGLAGLVTDADGKPVEGVRVHVYDHIQMSERPKYVSEKTGMDGRYFVPVKRGGTYYLAARDRFGGPPQLGDLFGRFDEGTVDPSGVVVRKGETTSEINITVHKVW
jgi:hypothetical protein